jgi:type IX secretion system PorP/SprF family membrane protein
MITLFVLGASMQVQGQTQQFSFTQYMDNLTPLNPAYSLLDQAGSINTMARKQWVGIDGAPTTFLLNANIPVASISGAAGLIVMNDQFAIERQTEANIYFAKAIQLGQNNYLGVSLNAGIRNYRANYSTLDSTDPAFANDVRETKPNIGFGVIYFSDWYYIGVSVPELTITSLGTASVQNNNNFKSHYYFTGAFIKDIGEDFKVKPSILFSYAKGVPLITDFSGILYIRETLGIGASYRLNEEMAGILTLNLDRFHIGYSYQFGTSSSNLGGFNMATHEVSFGYRFGKGIGKRKLL